MTNNTILYLSPGATLLAVTDPVLSLVVFLRADMQ
jgi:hypothetical protein